MAAFILGGAIILGSALFANKERGDAARKAETLLQDQIDERNLIIDESKREIATLLRQYEEGKLPIPKIEVEKGELGAGFTEAVAAAKNRNDIEVALDQENVRLAAAANVSDPRIRAAVMKKANKESRKHIDQVSKEVAEREIGALTNLGQAQTKLESEFASAKNQAEQQYAQNSLQYFMSEQDRLNDILTAQGEATMDLGYQAGMVVPMAQAQNAADFSNAVTDIGIAAAGYDFSEKGGVIKKAQDGTVIGGPKVDYLDRFQEFFDSVGSGSALSGLTSEEIAMIAKNYNQKKKKNSGSDVDDKNDDKKNQESDLDSQMNSARSASVGGVTRGEFNHGDIDDPMSGNDQVLIDQEDLKRGLDSGDIKSYEDIEGMDMIQMISTGGEGVLDEANFLDTNDLVDAANPNNPLRLEDVKLRDGVSAEQAMKGVLLAGKGTKVKGKGKKSQKEMDKAARLLAKYLSVVLSEPQFQE